MRTRTIMTVALLSAGCGTSGTPRQAPATRPTAAATTPPTGPAPAVATTVMVVPAPVTAASAPTSTLGPDQLELLAAELTGAAPEQVQAQLAHFRPLCDAQGYPLVGNLVTKGGGPPRVAAFCADVRGRR